MKYLGEVFCLPSVQSRIPYYNSSSILYSFFLQRARISPEIRGRKTPKFLRKRRIGRLHMIPISSRRETDQGIGRREMPALVTRPGLSRPQTQECIPSKPGSSFPSRLFWCFQKPGMEINICSAEGMGLATSSGQPIGI